MRDYYGIMLSGNMAIDALIVTCTMLTVIMVVVDMVVL